ncbi:MAG: hypothetical protein JNM22_12595 [Saprospiraceae bacterium]|nr:hypothetical protein [Saprospiraceae bacterium]
MPIIFFVISLFLANQNAVTIAPKGDSETKQTVKTVESPTDGKEYIISSEIMP